MKQARILQASAATQVRSPTFSTCFSVRLESSLIVDWIVFQVPSSSSQQMDDLFDILIESGGEDFCVMSQATCQPMHNLYKYL